MSLDPAADWDNGYARGKREERAAIVEWLRTCDTANGYARAVLDNAADCIEEGEHAEEKQ